MRIPHNKVFERARHDNFIQVATPYSIIHIDPAIRRVVGVGFVIVTDAVVRIGTQGQTRPSVTVIIKQ